MRLPLQLGSQLKQQVHLNHQDVVCFVIQLCAYFNKSLFVTPICCVMPGEKQKKGGLQKRRSRLRILTFMPLYSHSHPWRPFVVTQVR